MPISHVGSSSFMSGNTNFHLNNVLCIPTAHKSLLSIRRFSHDKNCYFEFDAYGFRVKDLRTKKILLSGRSFGGLYHLVFDSTFPNSPLALVGERVNQDIWHSRLGHPLRYSGSDLLGVTAKIVDMPPHYVELHPDIKKQFWDAQHWPKHVLVRYTWHHVLL